MSKKQWSACINALLKPDDADVRRVSDIWFITDKKLQKQAIINYLRDYSAAKDLSMDSYITLLDNDDIKYESLCSTFCERIQKSGTKLKESVLLHLTEKEFFVAYGTACRNCTSKEKLSPVPDDYNEAQTRAMNHVADGYKNIKKRDLGPIYFALNGTVKKHRNGRPRTEKKYIKDCERRASWIMTDYRKRREGKADNDAVFNDGKNRVVHDVADDLINK